MATTSTTPVEGASRTALVAAALVGGLLLTTYAPLLLAMSQTWSNNPEYSHGWLVPAFAAVLLWLRRPMLATVSWKLHWIGVAVLALAGGLRLVGGLFHHDWAQAVSLLIALAGLALLTGGMPALRWSWPGVAFLIFMVPLPYTAERLFAWPLQRVATLSSNYSLQAFGVPSSAEGTIIHLENGALGVEEACSGLSMLMIFLALSTAVAILMQRPLWQKLAIVASAAPVAVVVNVARITATGLIHEWFDPRWAQAVFHDFAGWVMMPAALAILGLELWLLQSLVSEEPEVGPLSLTGVQRR
jgi:exosortase